MPEQIFIRRSSHDLSGLGIELCEILEQAEERNWRLNKIDCKNNCGVIALTLFFSTPPTNFYEYYRKQEPIPF